MRPGTAKITTEYPEVGKLYRVHPWNIVHVPPSFIPSGSAKIHTSASLHWPLTSSARSADNRVE
jgi:hypothetical protein